MDWRTPAGTLVVVGVACAVLGIVGSLVFGSLDVGNALFRTSEFQVAALASLAVVVGALVVFMSIGRPWRLWKRTPYW